MFKHMKIFFFFFEDSNKIIKLWITWINNSVSYHQHGIHLGKFLHSFLVTYVALSFFNYIYQYLLILPPPEKTLFCDSEGCFS